MYSLYKLSSSITSKFFLHSTSPSSAVPFQNFFSSVLILDDDSIRVGVRKISIFWILQHYVWCKSHKTNKILLRITSIPKDTNLWRFEKWIPSLPASSFLLFCSMTNRTNCQQHVTIPDTMTSVQFCFVSKQKVKEKMS